MSRTPFTPTAQQKADALEHIHYEIEQLALLIHFPSASFPQPLANAWLEAVLVHVRILLDFFEHTRATTTQDDVLADDYGFAPAEITIVQRERINKEVHHLTYSRPPISGPNREWDFPNIINPILERSLVFTQHLRATALGGADANTLAQWEYLKQLLQKTLGGKI